MKITLANIYTCEHCGKRQFRKGDMTLHEKWCKKNPANQHKCFQFCKNLIKTEVEYSDSKTYNEEYTGRRTVFACALTGQEMYSFIAERRKLPVVSETDVIRMPLQCDSFESTYDIYLGEYTKPLDKIADDMPF